jgi:uncharacterized protein (TIGR03437 family)
MYSRFPLLFLPLLAFAQTAAPVISPGGIVNAASYTGPGAPGSGIAQGALFSLFGKGLGPAEGVAAQAFPLGKALAGTSVQVTSGTRVLDAIPVFVSSGQINAILPSNTPTGTAQLTVKFNGVASRPAPILVVSNNIGLFSVNSNGTGPAVVQNFASGGSLPLNAKSAPAKPGQVVILYGTGLGAGLNSDDVAPVAGDLNVPLEIFVGGKLASKYYSGRSPCCSGLDQITFTLPADVPLGCHVPVQLRTHGSEPSNVVTVAITPDGHGCSEAVQPLGDAATGNFGSVLLVRANLATNIASMPFLLSVDQAVAVFRTDGVGDFAFNSYFTPPPAGTCTVSAAIGDLFSSRALPGFAQVGKTLNAGPLTVANGTRQVTVPYARQQYSGELGYSLPQPLPSPGGLLDSGPVSITGAGGSDVGSFSVSVNPAPQVTLTKPTTSATVQRDNGLTVNWTINGGPANGLVFVAGGTKDSALRNSAAFLCTASATSTALTVPSAILQRIPGTGSGVVLVGVLQATPQSTFQASGIKGGAATAASISATSVSFQ